MRGEKRTRPLCHAISDITPAADESETHLNVVLRDDDLSGVAEVDEQRESEDVDVVDGHLRLVLLHQVVCNNGEQ